MRSRYSRLLSIFRSYWSSNVNQGANIWSWPSFLFTVVWGSNSYGNAWPPVQYIYQEKRQGHQAQDPPTNRWESGTACTMSPPPGDDMECCWPRWSARCEYWKLRMGNQEWHVLACGIQWPACTTQHHEGHCLSMWLQFESVCHKCMQFPNCTSILHSLLQMQHWRWLQKWVDCTRVYAWPQRHWCWIVFIPQVTLFVYHGMFCPCAVWAYDIVILTEVDSNLQLHYIIHISTVILASDWLHPIIIFRVVSGCSLFRCCVSICCVYWYH